MLKMTADEFIAARCWWEWVTQEKSAFLQSVVFNFAMVDCFAPLSLTRRLLGFFLLRFKLARYLPAGAKAGSQELECSFSYETAWSIKYPCPTSRRVCGKFDKSSSTRRSGWYRSQVKRQHDSPDMTISRRVFTNQWLDFAREDR